MMDVPQQLKEAFAPGAGLANRVGDAVVNAPPPQEDVEAKRLAQVRDQQIKEANKFRENLPEYQKKLGDQAEVSSRRKLANTLGEVKSGYNRRGLLYSGLRQSGEAGAQADASMQLAQERAQISDSLNQTADQYEAAALNSALQVNDMEADFQNQLYSRALNAMMARNQGIGSLLSAGGVAAGLAIGKGKK